MEEKGYLEGYRDKSRQQEAAAQDVEDIIRLLDDYAVSGGSRLKLKVTQGDGEVVSRQYHHGRCDIGSPWAKGEPFDVLEDK